VVILADTSHKGAMHVAERIRLNIIDLQIVHEKAHPLQFVTLSLGVATSTTANGRNRVESYTDIPHKPES